MKPKFEVGEIVWNTRINEETTITNIKIADKIRYDHTKLGSGSLILESEQFFISIEEKTKVDNLKNRFTYHSPKTNQIPKFTDIRIKGYEMAVKISLLCPPGIERDTAIQKVEEVIMWANAAIARNE